MFQIVIGVAASVLSLGYWTLGRARNPDALGLSLGLLMMFAASNSMRAIFPLVDAHGIGTPWAWTLLAPAHLLLLLGGYHAAKGMRPWAVLFMSAALFMLLLDAWFWATWWPLRNLPYGEAAYRIFSTYNETRNCGIMAELALVAIPGGIDGVLAVRGRHFLDVPGLRSGGV